MTDSATSRYKARQQSQGSNTNTWGDDKLNEVLRLLDRGSKGYQALAMTGDTTLTWTNYVATNDGQCAVLKLTGSLSSAASLTVPSAEWQWDVIWNTTGQTITVKTSAGTGVAIPNGRKAAVFCDATDCYLSVPNIIDSITLTNNRDSVDKLALETAIATASLPATAGTVLVTAADTTAGYLGAKVNVTGSGAATVTPSTTDPAGNEVKTFAVSVGALGLTDGGDKTTSFTAAVSTRYTVSGTLTMTTPGPTSTSPSKGDIFMFAKYGTALLTVNLDGLKFEAVATNPTTTTPGLNIWQYTDATTGWVQI